MKTRFTPATIIPLFLDTGPGLREALLLFLLKKKKVNADIISRVGLFYHLVFLLEKENKAKGFARSGH